MAQQAAIGTDAVASGEAAAAQLQMAGVLERQRAAFLRDGPPDYETRKVQLKRLRALVLQHRDQLGAAVSADLATGRATKPI